MSGFSPSVIAAIVTAAQRNGLEPMLLAALVMRESSGNPFAGRFEEGYPFLFDVLKKKPLRWERQAVIPSLGTCSGATERVWQQTSWGLCQVMGGTARELGFSGPFLSALSQPEEGAEYGARYLAKLVRLHGLQDGLSAYNAGSPTDANFKAYVSPILQTFERFRREGL